MTGKKSPRIEALVVNAIKRLQDVQGSTSREISNYISQEYNVPGPKVKKQVNMALRRGLSFGILHRSRGGYYSCGGHDIRNRPMDTAEVILRGGRRRCKSRRRRRRKRCKSRRRRRKRCKSRRRRRKRCKSRRSRRRKRSRCKSRRRRSRRSRCRRSRRRSRRCKPKCRPRRRRRRGRCCEGVAGDKVTFSGTRGPREASFAAGGSQRSSSGSDLSAERQTNNVAAPSQDVSPATGNSLD